MWFGLTVLVVLWVVVGYYLRFLVCIFCFVVVSFLVFLFEVLCIVFM